MPLLLNEAKQFLAALDATRKGFAEQQRLIFSERSPFSDHSKEAR